jgi:tetratricopeptide (TPR) repeat protein
MTRHVLAAIAVIVTTTGSFLEAQRLVDERSRRDAIQFYQTGREFFAAEKFARAAEEFAKAANRDPLFALAYYSLGQSYMQLNRYVSAIKAFQDCIEASRGLYSVAQTNRFAVERARDDEIREMRETIQLLQKSGHPLLAIRADQHLHDLENQRTSIDGAFHPPAETLLSLGSAFYRNGNRDEAESAWNAAIEVNPSLGEVHNNLAVLYMVTGRFDQAEEELTLAEKNGVKVNPQFKDDLKTAKGRSGKRN